MTPSWLANPQDEDDPWMADPRFFRDCRFDSYNGGGWVVPRHRREDFAALGLPLKGSPGPARQPETDRVPVGMRHTSRLDRQADRLLEGAYGRLRNGAKGKTGALRDANRRKVISLIGYDQTGPDVVLGEPAERPDVSGLLDDLRGIAGLTRSELAVVECLAEGDVVSVQGWTAPVADRLGKSIDTIRVHWCNAKRKLVEHWAAAPEPRTRPVLRSDMVGHTRVKLIDQGFPPVFPYLPLDEIIPAIRAYVREEWRNKDWDETPSMTADGWQLWDDALWAAR